MSNPTLSVVVSRTGADLDLDNRTTHRISSWHVPDLEWRRRTVSGPYQAGEVLISAVPEAMTVPLQVLCLGDTWADVDAAENEMRVALQQWSYSLTITTGGVIYQFTGCQPANIRPLGDRRKAGDIEACISGFAVDIRCTPVIGSEA